MKRYKRGSCSLATAAADCRRATPVARLDGTMPMVEPTRLRLLNSIIGLPNHLSCCTHLMITPHPDVTTITAEFTHPRILRDQGTRRPRNENCQPRAEKDSS
jgi:hypothetical protein